MAKKFMSMLVWSVTGLVCSAVVFVLWCDGAARAQQAQIPVAQAEKPNLSGSAWVPASVPRIIAMNGSLRDLDNRPLTGVIGVSFSLYREQQGGAPLWTEIQNVHLDEQGRYTVLLGATRDEGVPMELFSSAESRWLSVQAQLPGQEELPRILLASVPYALHAGDADTIGGKPASAFVLASPDGQLAFNLAKVQPERSAMKGDDSPAIFAVSGTGTTNRVAKWVDDVGTLGNSLMTDQGAAVTLQANTNNITAFQIINDIDGFDVMTMIGSSQSELALWSASTSGGVVTNHYTAVGSTSHSYNASLMNHNITGDASYVIAGSAMTAGLFLHADAGDIHFRARAQTNLDRNTDICLMSYSFGPGTLIPLQCEIDSANDATYMMVKNATAGPLSQALFTAISDQTQGQISMGTTSSTFTTGANGIPARAGFIYSGANNTAGLYLEANGGALHMLTNGATERAILSSNGWQWQGYGAGAIFSNASGNISSGTLSVSNGGTGATTFTTNRIPYYTGSTFTSSVLSQTNGEIHQVSGTKFYLDQNPSGVSFANDQTALAGDTNTLYFYHRTMNPDMTKNIFRVTDAQSDGTCIWINNSLRRLSLSGSNVVDGGAC